VSGAGGRLRSDVVVAALVLAVVAMLLVPLPRPLLDVLLAGNLARPWSCSWPRCS
jgi:type III secretory pathway component EscV